MYRADSLRARGAQWFGFKFEVNKVFILLAREEGRTLCVEH